MAHEPQGDRDARRRSRLRRLGRLLAALLAILLIYGLLFGSWWGAAVACGYVLVTTVTRAQMTRRFGPEWQDVPPEVSVIAHLRRLRRERRAEEPAPRAPTRATP